MALDNRFVFVIPVFNAEKTIERMLGSIFLQSYDNWFILIRDDMSTDSTIDTIDRTCTRNGIRYGAESSRTPELGEWEIRAPEDAKVKAIRNHEKLWEVENVLKMINDSRVKDSDIICRIDGDDFLTDLCALQDINQAYKASGADFLWTMHRWSGTESPHLHYNETVYTCEYGNISNHLPDHAGRQNTYKHPWVTSHLKTFRKALLNGVSDENFRGPDGEYIKRAGDQAICLPALHKAQKRVFFPRVMYHYNIDVKPETFATADAKFQRDEALFLRERGFVA